MNYKFKMGEEVTEKITGFSGIVTGAASYLTGCNQMLVQPPVADSKWVDGQWFDEGRLKKVRKAITKKSVKSSSGNGACGVAPVK